METKNLAHFTEKKLAGILLEDLFIDSAAKIGPMFTKKSLNYSVISLSSEAIISLTRISLTERFITSASK